MAQGTTDKDKSKYQGLPLTTEKLAEYNKVWLDMDACIAYCKKHTIRQTRAKKK